MVSNIGFWGLTFNSGNMGCNALSYSFLSILDKLVAKPVNVYVFYQGGNSRTSHLHTEKITVIDSPFNPRSYKDIKGLIENVKKCDISFDFTAGDSFSDIYGLKGFIKSCMFKKLAIKYSKKFVLGPQTYGPYSHPFARMIAKDILKQADYVCTRDAVSAEFVKALVGIDIDVYTDVAFALPFANNCTINTPKKKVGINVSGLLWNGGYTGTNQFNLTVDYCKYITNLIEELLSQGDKDIYIIPHVISPCNPENDYNISEELVAKYPELHLAPRFITPIEAKSYIAEMDVFTGARMHATIGAFSAGVITIPFSYSRKFEGLYNNLGYSYVVNAKELDTNAALNLTIKYINNTTDLKTKQLYALDLINKKVNAFELCLKGLL